MLALACPQDKRTIIARNATESFFPKRSELYSNWLLDSDGFYTYCRYYPSPVQLVTVPIPRMSR